MGSIAARVRVEVLIGDGGVEEIEGKFFLMGQRKQAVVPTRTAVAQTSHFAVRKAVAVPAARVPPAGERGAVAQGGGRPRQLGERALRDILREVRVAAERPRNTVAEQPKRVWC